jgi:hypothetical protein
MDCFRPTVVFDLRLRIEPYIELLFPAVCFFSDITHAGHLDMPSYGWPIVDVIAVQEFGLGMQMIICQRFGIGPQPVDPHGSTGKPIETVDRRPARFRIEWGNRPG